MSTQALVAPFVALHAVNFAHPPGLLPSLLLIIGVCQPGIVLAVQVCLSEGFWYSSNTPAPLASSSAAEMKRQGRRSSSFATLEKSRSNLPGLPVDTADCNGAKLGRVGGLRAGIAAEHVLITATVTGRVLSMAQPHPKLLILSDAPQENDVARATGRPRPASLGHVRLRSLTLARISKSNESHAAKVERRFTSGGFDHRAVSPMPDPEVIARSLLAHKDYRLGSTHGGFDHGRTTTPSLDHSSANEDDAALRTAPDYTIDSLSAQLLPGLLPGVVIGKDTPVLSASPRRSSVPDPSMMSQSHYKTRQSRNLSLPVLSLSRPHSPPFEHDTLPPLQISIAEQHSTMSGTGKVATAVGEDTAVRRQSWHDKSVQVWNRLEAAMKQDKAASKVVQAGQGRIGDDYLETIQSVDAFEREETKSPTPNDQVRNSSMSSRAWQHFDDSDARDDDEEAIVHCATIRPVSRSAEQTIASVADARPASRPSSVESITSIGFQNVLSTGSELPAL